MLRKFIFGHLTTFKTIFVQEKEENWTFFKGYKDTRKKYLFV